MEKTPSPPRSGGGPGRGGALARCSGPSLQLSPRRAGREGKRRGACPTYRAVRRMEYDEIAAKRRKNSFIYASFVHFRGNSLLPVCSLCQRLPIIQAISPFSRQNGLGRSILSCAPGFTGPPAPFRGRRSIGGFRPESGPGRRFCPGSRRLFSQWPPAPRPWQTPPRSEASGVCWDRAS